MRRTFRLTRVDCANCAAEMERRILELDGVRGAAVSVFTQTLTLDVDEEAEERFESLAAQAEKLCRKVEPDCRLLR